MSQASSTRSPSSSPGSDGARAWIQCLPGYSRSLLKVRVPVSVTLAKKKQSVVQILEMVPGSIIQFNKLCDEALELEVGNQTIAEGEAVKVGDKFGLRITSLVMPEERFHSVMGKKTEEAGEELQR